MKRTFWTLNLLFVSALAAQAQSPSATLGLPYTSLGLPVPARNAPPRVQPANFAEPPLPALTPPAPAATSNPPLTPYRLNNDPKPMPNAPAIDEGQNPPIFSGPPTTAPVDVDEPLFNAPASGAPLAANRFYLTAEYLMWWTGGFSVPALLTTGPATLPTPGALGQPGVSTLYGNQTINNGFSNGVRTGFVWWFGPRQLWAFDGHFFLLSQVGQTANFTSFGSPLLARPFYDVNDGINTAELLAAPGAAAGGIAISSTSSLYGFDINLRRKLCQGCNSYFDGLVGYRFLSLQEQVTISETSTQLPPIDPAFPVSGSAFDRFLTTNQFNGGQLGAVMGTVNGRWSLNLRTMVALGETSSIAYVEGSHSFLFANGTTSAGPGGLYALNSNMGRYSLNSFSVVPEVTFNVGYNLTPHCRIFAGYNFLYWSNVLRPGNQINQNLDVNRIPGFTSSPNVLATAHPTVPLTTSDFFAQGLNLGLMFSW